MLMAFVLFLVSFLVSSNHIISTDASDISSNLYSDISEINPAILDENALELIQNAEIKNNCTEIQTIFILTENVTTNFFNATKSTGPCLITLIVEGNENLTQPTIRFEEIISSSNGACEILSLYQNQYFSVNSVNSMLWKDTTIYAGILKIIIPPSKFLNMTVTANIENPVTIVFDEAEQHGILASPSYSGPYPDDEYYDNFTQLYKLESNTSAEYHFFVKSISEDPIVLLETSILNVTLKSNQTIKTNGTAFKIFYQQQNSLTDNFLIEYTVLNPAPSSTMPSTSVPSTFITHTYKNATNKFNKFDYTIFTLLLTLVVIFSVN